MSIKDFFIGLLIPIVITIIIVILIRFFRRKGKISKKTEGELETKQDQQQHDDSHSHSSPPQKSSFPLGKIISGVAITAIIVVLSIVAIKSANALISSIFPSRETVSALPCSVIHYSPRDTTYEIPANGKVTMYLHPGWADFPTGKIKIITPAYDTLKDKPGVKNHFGFQPDGKYEFVADTAKCSVRITNRN